MTTCEAAHGHVRSLGYVPRLDCQVVITRAGTCRTANSTVQATVQATQFWQLVRVTLLDLDRCGLELIDDQVVDNLVPMEGSVVQGLLQRASTPQSGDSVSWKSRESAPR